jgi:ubiquinone/menaquinone biosynthesis C-methylase UbiE
MTNIRLAEKLAALNPEKRKLLQKMIASKREPHPVSSTEFEPQALQSFYSQPERTKQGTQSFYDTINDQLDQSIFAAYSAFLNYGYVADDSPSLSAVEIAPRMLNRASVKLVLELIGDCDLAAKRVLDVGCGRGGTLAVVNQFFDAATKVGVDLSSHAIAYCRRTHHLANTSFEQADAEQLPFSDASFDAVLNIESSHSYLDIDAFYREVKRVLAAGGYFLYTDVFARERFDRQQERLRQMGFSIERERDITRNVLLSCRETAERRAQAFQPTRESSILDDFLSTPGSSVFQEMESGGAVYRILKMRRS